MKKNIFIIALLTILTIALGFLRDHVFVTINQLIESGNDSHDHLMILKWGLTFFCSTLYLGITSVFLFLIFHSRKYAGVAVVVYLLIFLIALLVGLVGFLTTSFWNVYPLVRSILGIAQSPIVLMILIPACYINEIQMTNNSNG